VKQTIKLMTAIYKFNKASKKAKTLNRKFIFALQDAKRMRKELDDLLKEANIGTESISTVLNEPKAEQP